MADQTQNLSTQDITDVIAAQQHLYAAGDPRAEKVYNFLVKGGYATANAQGGLQLSPSTLTENSAGRGTYSMWNTGGQQQAIPYDKVPFAYGQGYRFDQNENKQGLTPKQVYLNDFSADPANKGKTPLIPAVEGPQGAERQNILQAEDNQSVPMALLTGAAKMGGEMMRPLEDVAALTSGTAPPDNLDLAARGTAEKVGKIGAGVAAVGAGLATAPAATIGGMAAGTLGGAAGQIAGKAAGMSPAGTAVLSDALGLGAGAAGAEGAEAVAPKIGAAAVRLFPAAFDGPPESLLTRAIKPNKNNVNWNANLRTAIPLMKSAEDSLGHPVGGVDDALTATKVAKQGIWQQIQARLSGAGQMGATIDGNQIADAMMASIDKRTALQNPAKVAQIKATADTYRGPMSVADAEDFLQSSNAEMNAYYAKNKVARSVAERDPEIAYKLAEGDALRGALYDKMDQIGGPGAAQLKQAYGALTNVQKELYGRQLVAARQNPESLSEQLSTARGVGTAVKGVVTLPFRPLGALGDIAEGTQNVAISRAIKARNSSDAMITRAFAKAQPATPFPPSLYSAFNRVTRQPITQAEALGRLLPRGPIQTPSPADASGAVSYAPPAYSPDTRASRLGLLLPQQASGKIPLYPPAPEMSTGERIAALMQQLRQKRQMALPAQATPIQLPGRSWTDIYPPSQ